MGQFSGQDLVKERLARAHTSELTDQEAELAGVEQAWGRLEGQFLQHLDLLNREVITEPEFIKGNESARGQVAPLEGRRDERFCCKNRGGPVHPARVLQLTNFL